jgi:hypothetical protein
MIGASNRNSTKYYPGAQTRAQNEDKFAIIPPNHGNSPLIEHVDGTVQARGDHQDSVSFSGEISMNNSGTPLLRRGMRPKSVVFSQWTAFLDLLEVFFATYM